MKKLFQNSNFSLLFFGSLVSSIGTVLFSFCLGLYIQDIFNQDIYDGKGAFYFSIVLGVSIFGRVAFSPVAGALIDRWNKVRILVVTDVLRAILFSIVLYLLQIITSDYAVLYLFIVVSFLSGLFQAFFNPASTSLLPDVVGVDSLQKAIGINSIIGSFKTLFGVLLGMVLYEMVGIQLAIIINALSFFISGCSELFIHPEFQQKITKIKDSLHNEIKDGFLYLRRHQGLFHLLMFSIVLNFAFSPLFSVCIPYLFYTELGKNAYHIGAINIVIAVTTLLIGPMVGMKQFNRLPKILKRSFLSIFMCYIFIGIWVVLYPSVIPIYWIFYSLFMITTIGLTTALIITNIPVNSNIVKSIDVAVRGRVLSIVSAFSGLSVPLSYMLAGKLIERTNVSTTIFIYSFILLVPVIGFLTDRHVKRFVGDFR